MAQPDELIGRMLKQYEVQALVGSGGMAHVYRAFDHNLRRPVAIKVLSPSVARLPGFIERFRQEAMLAARLNHPNIIQVYDVEPDANGLSYIVEQFLPGPTLGQQIQTVRTRVQHFAPSEVIAAGRQIAGALDVAHRAGIIHRDVKPDNIIRDSDGRYVLTDFGIARQMEANTSLTQTGMIVGTPEYMSPEQAQGLRLTPATDIYSLGIVLYEMVTGRVPFSSTTPIQAVVDHVQTPPPPPSTMRPGLPPAVDAVFQRVLAKDPAMRYISASEFVEALQQAWLNAQAPAPFSTTGQPTVAQPPASGVYVPPPAPPPAVVPATPTGQQLPPPPAGAMPVYDQETQVWGSATPAPRRAAPRIAPPPPPPASPPPAPEPAASGGAGGDGQGGFPTWLAVLLGSVLTLAALAGGAFLFTQINAGGGGVGAVPTATMPPPTPTEVPPAPTEVPPAPTEVPPAPTEVPLPPTEIPPPPTEPPPPPTDTPVPPPTEVLPPFPTLAPDAPQAPPLSLTFSSNQLRGRRIFVAGTIGENARDLQTGEAPAWSPDGRHIAFHEQVGSNGGNDELFIMDSQGNNRIQITRNNVDDREPAWSPDGTRLVFWSDRDAVEQWDIFIVDLRTGEEQRVTTHPAGDFEPVWSPDGSRIAFTTNRDGNDEIYIYDLNTSTETNLTQSPTNEKSAAWSPNPELLAYQSDRAGNWDIFTNNPSNSNERQATDNPADDMMPSFSPNLQFLAFVSNRDGENAIFAAAPDGSAAKRLLGGNADFRDPAWSP